MLCLSWYTSFNLLQNFSQQTGHTLCNKRNGKSVCMQYTLQLQRYIDTETYSMHDVIPIYPPITYMWYFVTLSFNAFIQYSVHNTQKRLSWWILRTRCWNVINKGSERKHQWENSSIRKHECPLRLYKWKLTSKLFDFIISEIFAAERSEKRPCFSWNTSWNLCPTWCMDAADGSVDKRKTVKMDHLNLNNSI